MRQWKIKKQDEHSVAALCTALGCSSFFARLLYNRGICSAKEAESFLAAEPSSLLDPYLFAEMGKVVERIVEAIRMNQKVTVYGDYDVDGITATALLVEVLRELGGEADYYIPSRFSEGYGVNAEALKSIADSGTKLVITVDTGITAVEEVEFAKTLGLDMIITDHHECHSVLPDTLVINPKAPESGYPYAELAGVGVVYKLACALDQAYGSGDGKLRYAPLAAVGTVADIMPVNGENRFIVKSGLSRLKKTSNIGMRKLIERCLGDRPMDTSAVGFVIAPRINAAGRMGNATLGVDLLTTRDPMVAEDLVDELCRENNHRQETENKILSEAIEMLEKDPKSNKRSGIVLWSERWHNGVVGIVASRLKDRYGKPCILFSVADQFAKGSGRSVRPFNLFEAFEQLSDKVVKFGGHAFAAGTLVETARLEEFRDAFCAKIDTFLEQDSFDNSIEIDCQLAGDDLSLEKVQELERLAPFGRGNETPVFCMRNVRIIEASPTANGNHMRLSLMCGEHRVTAFYFNVAPAAFCYCAGETVDIVFEADINQFNGRRNVQLLLKDMRYNSAQGAQIHKDLLRLKRMQLRSLDVPERDDAVVVYRYLKRALKNGSRSFDLHTLQERIFKNFECRITIGKIYFSLETMRDLGVLEYDINDFILSNLVINSEKRVDLNDSLFLKQLIRKAGERS